MSYRSEFAPSVRAAPRRGLNELSSPQEISLDFTPDCKDVIYEDGYIRQIKGYRKLNTSAISGTPTITGGHEYGRSSGLRDMLIQADGNIMRLKGTAFETVKASNIVGERYRFVNGMDRCLVARGYQQPVLYWDGTVMRGLSQAPRGRYPFYYNDHFFMANLEGGGNQSSIIRPSEQRDFITWNTDDDINIETSDSEEITGIGQEGRYLAIFKKTSRTLVYGTFFKATSADYDASVIGTVQGIGCVGHDTIVNANNVLYVMDETGIWQLGGGASETTTVTGGTKLITATIPKFWKSVNFGHSGRFQSAHLKDKKWILWSVCARGANSPNFLIIYDYLNEGLWIREINSFGLWVFQNRPYFGDDAGFVHALFEGNDDNGSAIDGHIVWPIFGTESNGTQKLWDELEVVGENTGSHTTTLESWADGRFGDRRASTTFANSEGVGNQESEFRQFVSTAHTGETLQVKLKSNSIAGGPWGIRQIKAKGRVTEE